MERLSVCVVPTITPAFPDPHTYNVSGWRIVTMVVAVLAEFEKVRRSAVTVLRHVDFRKIILGIRFTPSATQFRHDWLILLEAMQRMQATVEVLEKSPADELRQAC